MLFPQLSQSGPERLWCKTNAPSVLVSLADFQPHILSFYVKYNGTLIFFKAKEKGIVFIKLPNGFSFINHVTKKEENVQWKEKMFKSMIYVFESF